MRRPLSTSKARRQHTGVALEILKMFGLEDAVERLMTSSRDDTAFAIGVHDLLNIVSLVSDLHVAFDRLKFAFEPTADGERSLGLQNRVTLTNFAQKRKFKKAGGVLELPLPEPRLFALHAVRVRTCRALQKG
ncbi:hypothetical protein B0H11DRAFT_1921331 [Mycena galericulata]|nr:hypothetical protein B0H11DRAFT_1921331 [Mycena galericulata]